MRSSTHGRTIITAVGAALLLLLPGFAAGVGVQAAPAGPVQVGAATGLDVTAKSPFTFDPSRIEMVPKGVTLTVNFTNADTLPHTFTILDREGYVVPSTASTHDLDVLVHTYGVLVNITANETKTYTASFTTPATAGWYEFFCMEPGHFAPSTGQDMYGFIAFGEDLPANLTVSGGPSGPGMAVFIIVGTIVSLTVLAIVLGFVIGRRRGAEHEMPPERLGYPEPSSPAPVPPTPPRAPPSS